MELNSLTRSVLKPELIKLLTSGKDITHVSDLAYYKPTTRLEDLEALLDATVTDAQWPAGATYDAKSLEDVSRQMSAILATKGPDNKDPDLVSEMLRGIKQAGMAVFARQHALLIGDGMPQTDGAGSSIRTMSSAQSTYVDNILKAVFQDLDAAVPFSVPPSGCTDTSTNPTCDKLGPATTMADFFDAAVKTISRSLMNNVEPDILNWLFPKQIARAYVYIGLGPYLRARYITTYMNKSQGRVEGFVDQKQRTDVSFYDARYAEYLLYDTYNTALQNLINLQTTNTSMVSDLQKAQTTLATTLSTRRTSQMEDTALLTMYTDVSNMSKMARDNSMHMNVSSKRLDMRKSRIRSLQWNVHSSEKQMRTAYSGLILWVALYVVAVLVGVYLLMTNQNGMFLAHLGVVCLGTLLAGVVPLLVKRAKAARDES